MTIAEAAPAYEATPIDGLHADVVVIGAGIVGLATARRLLETKPGMRVVVLDKERDVATHQSGHNSGVVHAGIYYAPGSLKAKLCREGKSQLEAFCAAKAIPLEHVGKLVVALADDELPRLDALHDRAIANGVPGIELVGAERIHEIEPHAAGIRAVWSPTTGIVDYRRVAGAFADDVVGGGGVVATAAEVSALDDRGAETVVRTSRGDVTASCVVSCAGLWSDRVARLSVDAAEAEADAFRIVPFRGDYYTLRPAAAALVRGLVYPVPDPRFPFLGVHFTRRIDGEVWAGPNAVLAFARDGYRRRDVSVRDLAASLRYPGFLRLAGRFWRTGAAEMWRDWSKRAFLAELRRYLPELSGGDITFGPSGVRAQAVARNGTMIDDFDIAESGRVIHVRNAPSPAATASLAIGRFIAERVEARLAG
ncbi:MAG: L-2-hydroxyglutarate oxidase [Chloroflexota bacterium]